MLAALLTLTPSSAPAAQHLGRAHAPRRATAATTFASCRTSSRSAGLATPIAGVFGPQTLRNVKRFQRARHLDVDGIVGPQVVSALRHVVAVAARAQAHGDDDGPSEHLGDRVLKKGLKGHDVRVLQDYLGRAGVDDAGRRRLRPADAAQRAGASSARADSRSTAIVGPQVVGALRGLGDGSAAGGTERSPRRRRSATRACARDGTAVAPADAPAAVKGVIAAGNRIATKPYVYGGGHGQWNDRGYDCSGSVSYALHGGGLIDDAARLGQLHERGARAAADAGSRSTRTPATRSWSSRGLRFDTSGANPSRWQSDMRSTGGLRRRATRRGL